MQRGWREEVYYVRRWYFSQGGVNLYWKRSNAAIKDRPDNQKVNGSLGTGKRIRKYEDRVLTLNG